MSFFHIHFQQEGILQITIVYPAVPSFFFFFFLSSSFQIHVNVLRSSSPGSFTSLIPFVKIGLPKRAADPEGTQSPAGH